MLDIPQNNGGNPIRNVAQTSVSDQSDVTFQPFDWKALRTKIPYSVLLSTQHLMTLYYQKMFYAEETLLKSVVPDVY